MFAIRVQNYHRCPSQSRDRRYRLHDFHMQRQNIVMKRKVVQQVTLPLPSEWIYIVDLTGQLSRLFLLKAAAQQPLVIGPDTVSPCECDQEHSLHRHYMYGTRKMKVFESLQ